MSKLAAFLKQGTGTTQRKVLTRNPTTQNSDACPSRMLPVFVRDHWVLSKGCIFNSSHSSKLQNSGLTFPWGYVLGGGVILHLLYLAQVMNLVSKCQHIFHRLSLSMLGFCRFFSTIFIRKKVLKRNDSADTCYTQQEDFIQDYCNRGGRLI